MATQVYYPVLKNGPISWNWVVLNGPDAKDFLHRLTTVNLRQMSPGDGAPGCFLTSAGKIRSYFYLWNPVKDCYCFEFDAGLTGKWKTDLLAIIDQYTFGEKFTLADLTSTLSCAWVFPNDEQMEKLKLPPLEKTEHFSQLGRYTDLSPEKEDKIQICDHGTTTYGRTWLSAWGTEADLNSWILKNFSNAKILSFAELENYRIQAVQPRMDSEITDTAVPLEIGLRTAIADNKGCYPGQEVIEKIVALGSPAKRLVRIEGSGAPPQVGDRVQALDPNTHQAGAEVGTVTTCGSIGASKFEVLALVRKTHAKEGIDVGFLNHPEMRGKVVKIAPHA